MLVLRNKDSRPQVALFVTLLLPFLAQLLVISIYIYLGVFSRYIADDYCEAMRFEDKSLIGAVVERYLDGDWRAANRYSNLLFVGLGERLGSDNMQIVIMGMVVLWAIGLIWLVHEIRRILGIRWHVLTDANLGAILAFFSLFLAPALFQTIYWRSAMMTHFAPLVFVSFLFAFLVRRSRLAEAHPPSPLVYTFVFISAFLIAGFSEPPTTTLLVIIPLMIMAILMQGSTSAKRRQVTLFGWMFGGIVLGFLVMALSPAVSNVTSGNSFGLVLVNSFYYALLFTRDSFTTVPLPLFLSFLAPFLLIWSLKQMGAASTIVVANRQIFLFIVALVLILWVLIAASFSPSVFGQSFPVERARFLARTLLILALMMTGIGTGMWLPEFKFDRKITVWTPFFLFILIAAMYPIRIAYGLVQTLTPEYARRAELWDLREDYILRHAAQGETDLIIPGFPGFYGVKELDDDPTHWINQCAAQYYGVNSIRTVPVEDEFLMEALSE